MKSLPLFALSISFFLASSPLLAGSGGSSSSSSGSTSIDSALNQHVYDLYTQESGFNIDYTLDGNSSNIVIDGTSITVGVSAWADTANISTDGISYDDNEVVYYDALNGYRHNNDYGFGLVNSNSNDSHTLDNFSGGDDFDMVLFSFSEAVTLTGASFTYLESDASDKQISIVGLSDISLFENHASNEFGWADVASGDGLVISNGHFGISSNSSGYSSSSSYSSEFSDLSAAKYWLVGAYNVYFDAGSSNYQNTGFKLASLNLTTGGTEINQPPSEVSEPAPIILMLTGLGLLALRRKRGS
jgi:hypothetical protein